MNWRSCLLFPVLLLPAVVAAQEAGLGRLFFTPEQRAALDARRKAKVPNKPATTPAVQSPVTRVDGAVRRTDGRSTVWVNGEAIPDGAPAAGARLVPQGPRQGRVSLPTGENEQRLDLRVGESVDRGTGQVRDVIGDGEIRIGSRRAVPAK